MSGTRHFLMDGDNLALLHPVSSLGIFTQLIYYISLCTSELKFETKLLETVIY